MRPSLKYQQNFFKDFNLVNRIVREADFNSKDVVYEIGPGKGIITSVLAQRVAKVISIEIDSQCYQALR